LIFIKNSGKKTRGNSNKSGENFISNFDRLIHLILNFVKYVQIGPNGPITVHKFEFLKKNQEKICKKLDKILRLLMKIFFFKSTSFGWLKFKFYQISESGPTTLQPDIL
jgi:hypothetical protein